MLVLCTRSVSCAVWFIVYAVLSECICQATTQSCRHGHGARRLGEFAESVLFAVPHIKFF